MSQEIYVLNAGEYDAKTIVAAFSKEEVAQEAIRRGFREADAYEKVTLDDVEEMLALPPPHDKMFIVHFSADGDITKLEESFDRDVKGFNELERNILRIAPRCAVIAIMLPYDTEDPLTVVRNKARAYWDSKDPKVRAADNIAHAAWEENQRRGPA